MTDDDDVQKHLMAEGTVELTPGAQQPYTVVFRLNGEIFKEYPVASVHEGEELIRQKTGRGHKPRVGAVPDIKAPYRPD